MQTSRANDNRKVYTMEEDDDQTRQAEEIEALSSIYGDDWIAVDIDKGQYCIRIIDEKFEWAVVLEVQFPFNYPGCSPPQYQLNAPWLRGEERQNLEGALAEIYCENIGESVIYLWVEKIRDMVQMKSQIDEPVKSEEHQVSEEGNNDEDDEDDDFDLSSLELELTSSCSSEQPDDGECKIWKILLIR